MKQITEEEWKQLCDKAGTYCPPLLKIKKEYANISISLRIYIGCGVHDD